MRKQSIFQSYDEHDGKLETLCRVSGHQRDLRVSLVVILIRNEGRVVDEFTQTSESLLVVVDCRVDQLLEILESPIGFVSFFCTQRSFITSVENYGAHDIRNR